MKLIRILIIAIGCLIAGITLIHRSITGIPALEDLKVTTGTVSFDSRVRRYRTLSAEDTVLIIDGKQPGYAYLDWFPAIEDKTAIRPGDVITIWYHESKEPWAWQIKKGDTIIVPYQVIADAVKSNNRFDPLLGSIVLVFSTLAFKKLNALRRAAAAARAA